MGYLLLEIRRRRASALWSSSPVPKINGRARTRRSLACLGDPAYADASLLISMKVLMQWM
jgi:hypothetical protein